MSVPNAPRPIVIAQHVSKSYLRGKETVRALAGVSFSLAAGEFVMLRGESGSGKSTLLNLCGCLDAPGGGHLELFGTNVADINESESTALRRDRIGFIFQNFHLIPVLTAVENVEYAFNLRGQKGGRAAALAMLDEVGMAKQAYAKVTTLSGGQMQRVAIARALVTSPSLVLADEPTANLDSRNTESVMRLLSNLTHSRGVGVLLVTHDISLSRWADRVIELSDGLIRLDISGGRTQSLAETSSNT